MAQKILIHIELEDREGEEYVRISHDLPEDWAEEDEVSARMAVMMLASTIRRVARDAKLGPDVVGRIVRAFVDLGNGPN